jgi:hypothetical protein
MITIMSIVRRVRNVHTSHPKETESAEFSPGGRSLIEWAPYRIRTFMHDMGIYHRGSHILMPENLLYGAYVIAVLK